MNHLTTDEIIDAVEGDLAPERREHLDECAACRRSVTELASVLQDAHRSSVPEPSPIFWRQFSGRVRDAVDADAASTTPLWQQVLRWPVLAPAGALAVLVVVLVLSMPALTDTPGTLPVRYNTEAGDVALVAGDGWMLVADLVGAIDWETAGQTGLILEPGDADRAALDLSAEEQRELTRLLQEELRRTES